MEAGSVPQRGEATREGNVGVGDISEVTFTQPGESIGQQGCSQQNSQLPGTQGRPHRRKSTRGQQAEDPDGVAAGTNSVFVLECSLRELGAVEAKRKRNRAEAGKELTCNCRRELVAVGRKCT